ncbi:MAG: FAD-dependent oxidoreductase [Candidatus Krumholzibacteriota bacterium]|nr:FAD-dependent oxidoreductase [Candidatus Krumholzibacteriota bacterium]
MIPRPRIGSLARHARRSPALLAALALLLAAAAPAAGQAPADGGSAGVLAVVDVQKTRVVEVPAGRAPAERLRAEVAVVGGGVGGVAAALAALEAGRTVVLAEETDWLGGQFTSQAMSAPDENQFVERGGATRSYQELRRRIRDWYRRNRRLDPLVAQDPELNPGHCWASRLCHEPRAALAAIESLLAPHRDAGRLRVLARHKILRAERQGRRVAAVDLVDLDTGAVARVEAAFFLDATELGDLLPACDVPHIVGAESREETGEPHARPDGPAPGCVQAFTYPFIVEYRPGENHVVARPPDYERNREKQPYSHTVTYHGEDGEPVQSELLMFKKAPTQQGSFWRYRRVIDHEQFRAGEYCCDLAIVNWPGNDSRANLLDGTPAEIVDRLRAAKDLSLGFLHWLQTELPNDEGGRGYPGLRLRPDQTGTADGLAKHPYVREARRIRTRRPLREQDISGPLNPDRFGGEFFRDAVAIGYYPFDIHPGACEEIIPPRPTWPFQIPLSVLVPLDVDNLAPAGKSAGTTHLTNACTRLHPVEWALGEAAGTLAALCVERRLTPPGVQADPRRVRELQRRLVARGAPIYWYTNVKPTAPGFAEAQFAPFDSDSVRIARQRRPTGRSAPGE